jgi:hypothetical protein
MTQNQYQKLKHVPQSLQLLKSLMSFSRRHCTLHPNQGLTALHPRPPSPLLKLIGIGKFQEHAEGPLLRDDVILSRNVVKAKNLRFFGRPDSIGTPSEKHYNMLL